MVPTEAAINMNVTKYMKHKKTTLFLVLRFQLDKLLRELFNNTVIASCIKILSFEDLHVEERQ